MPNNVRIMKSGHIQSVARATALLMHVAGRGGATASEAAAAHGLAVPTAHHLLSTMVDEGLLAKDGRGLFVLGPKALVIGHRALRQDSVPAYLMNPLRGLVEETGETAYLAAWRHSEITTLAWIEGANALRVAEVERGPYRLAHARATGKLLLAFAPPELREAYLADHPLEACTANTITDPAKLDAELAKIRARGWAEDREEFLEGVSCLSAPAIVEGVVIAAFTVSSPAARYAGAHRALRDSVLRAAGSLAASSSDGVEPARAARAGA
jgi:IclR family transcriptional regulator, acetate operon repressor